MPAWPIHLTILLSASGVHGLAQLSVELMWTLLAFSAVTLSIALCVYLLVPKRFLKFIAVFVAIFLGIGAANAGFVVYRALDRINARLAPELDGQIVRLTGVIHTLPTQYDQGHSFQFFVEQCEGIEPTLCPINRVVRLSWFVQVPKALLPGQRWQLSARMKRPHAKLNPYLFDAELRMFEEGIVASGLVSNKLGSPAILKKDLFKNWEGFPWWIERARHHLREAIDRGLTGDSYALVAGVDEKLSKAVRGVMVALVVGDQGAIPASWWEVFNQSGVGHLMSISGLHVTMMAGSVAGVAVLIWHVLIRFLPLRLVRFLPCKQTWRWLAGVSGAWLYTAIAGFGIPAQRTCWMVTLAAITVLTGRNSSAGSVILFTASAVVLLDPWAVLSAGFWLSFGAVSAIIYFGSAPTLRSSEPRLQSTPEEIQPHRKLRDSINRWMKSTLSESWQSQVAATCALLPIGAAFFSSFALLGPVANAVAIPLVSALVTPLAIVGALLNVLQMPWLGSSLLFIGAEITAPLLEGLRWLAGLPSAVAVIGQPTDWLLILAFLGLLLSLAPIKIVPLSARVAGALALLPIAVQSPEKPALGQAWINIFDVGQGTAVLVETHSRRLLFDTGPMQGSESDAGSSVIAPYLRARGLSSIDGLVLSHLDPDHVGGIKGVLKYLTVGWVASSVARKDSLWAPLDQPKHVTTKFVNCQRGDQWEWDGVRFEFLHPNTDDLKPLTAENARSCVLRVATNGGAALFAGDVGIAQEKAMVAYYRGQGNSYKLKADVMLVPNHGSKTSSSPQWLAATQPAVAIFQVGYRNRFKYPDPAVQQRYEKIGAVILRSDEQGAVRVTLPHERADGDLKQSTIARLQLRALRNDLPPYWRTKLNP
jgi:competence protein ComEC